MSTGGKPKGDFCPARLFYLTTFWVLEGVKLSSDSQAKGKA